MTSPSRTQPTALNVTLGITGKGAPLALRGFDPVAYFAQGEATLGTATHSVEYGGATYRFTSNEHLTAFLATPDAYLPQYGGFCAYGASLGAKFDGDPQIWAVVDGKLYLNLNADIQEAWDADRSGAVTKADTRWPSIREADPSTLSPQS